MIKNKIIDCITFFDNNFIFDLRYNILNDFVDYFVICESKFDHQGNEKEINFKQDKIYDQSKIRHIVMDERFPDNTNAWQNQAIQREFLLKSLNFANEDDYIFFSDPDEIPRPEILKNFNLKKNMEFLCNSVLIISLIYTINMKAPGKELGSVKEKTYNQ